MASQKRTIPPYKHRSPQGSGRKEAPNVRQDGHHPRLDLTIAHFR